MMNLRVKKFLYSAQVVLVAIATEQCCSIVFAYKGDNLATHQASRAGPER